MFKGENANLPSICVDRLERSNSCSRSCLVLRNPSVTLAVAFISSSSFEVPEVEAGTGGRGLLRDRPRRASRWDEAAVLSIRRFDLIAYSRACTRALREGEKDFSCCFTRRCPGPDAPRQSCSQEVGSLYD